MDQIEFEISRIHGLTEKTSNKGSVWVKYDLGYSKDEKTGATLVKYSTSRWLGAVLTKKINESFSTFWIGLDGRTRLGVPIGDHALLRNQKRNNS